MNSILNETRVYVGTYKKYNEGNLFGKWLTLSNYDSAEAFYTDCKRLHQDEQDPELMFQDWEYPEIFNGFIGECHLEETIFEIASLLEEKSDDDMEIIQNYLYLTGMPLNEHTIEQAHKTYVPYYTMDDCFLGYIYENFNDWIVNDWDDPQEKEVALLHLQQAQYVGDHLYQKIRNYKNLQLFEKRINDFKASNEVEQEVLQISKAFFLLWQDFPSANLYTYLNREEISDEEELFTIDKYISFAFDTQSDFFECQIIGFINGEFSQCGEIEVPTFVNRFDGISPHFNFDFESLFFSLLHRLINLLNTF